MIKLPTLTLASAAAFILAGCASKPDSCCDLSDSSSAPNAAAASRFAVFGTNRVHYVMEGKGDHTIVLVHCWAGNLSFWNEQVPALKDRARLILVDLPGHGQSDKPHTAYTMDFFAGAVLAVMRDARVDKATFIGHSMGVPVICRVYTQAPERVAALVAVDGTLRRPPMTREQAEQFKGPFNAPDYRAHTTNFIGAMFPIPGTEAVRDRVLGELLATPQYVMAGAMDGMFNADQPDWDLKQVKVPVLVINTDSPMWSDEYKSYARSLSPQTDYVAIAGTGHWLMLEKPAEFNSALLGLLQKFNLIAK